MVTSVVCTVTIETCPTGRNHYQHWKVSPIPSPSSRVPSPIIKGPQSHNQGSPVPSSRVPSPIIRDPQSHHQGSPVPSSGVPSPIIRGPQSHRQGSPVPSSRVPSPICHQGTPVSCVLVICHTSSGVCKFQSLQPATSGNLFSTTTRLMSCDLMCGGCGMSCDLMCDGCGMSCDLMCSGCGMSCDLV